MHIHKVVVYAGLGWLTMTGILHFVIDVVSQYLRGQRVPGPETNLYYGLNTAYSLGQVLFGTLGLVVAKQALGIWGQWPALVLSGLATTAWLAFGFCFIEYQEPKVMVGIFGVLVSAMALTR